MGDSRSFCMKCWAYCADSREILKYAPELPLIGLPRIPIQLAQPYLNATELARWTEANILTVGDCIETGSIMPFEGLMDLYELPVGQFLKYEGLKVSIRELSANPDEPTPHLVLQRLLTIGRGRHLVTWIYKALGEMLHTCPRAPRNRWERDLGRALTDKEWGECLGLVKKISRNT